MEKITDFFRELKDRLSNPLFSSFLVAWLIINWQIPIGLLFYSNQTLKADGYNSYMDLISKKYSEWNYIIEPLLFAVAYTFIFPFLRNVILAFQTWIKTKSTNWNLEISKSGKVSMERYIQLRKKYFNQIETVEAVFKEEANYLEQNKELNTEKIKLTTQNNKLSSDLDYWQRMNDSRILDGEWDYIFKSSELDAGRNYRVTIMGGQFHIYSDPSKRHKIETYSLSDFFCNPMNYKLCFVLTSMSDSKIRLLHNLHFPNGITELTGTENHFGIIVYRKLRE